MIWIRVKRREDELVIKWLWTTVKIPFEDILDVQYDKELTAGDIPHASVPVGIPTYNTEQVRIYTDDRIYLLFSMDPASLEKRINRKRKEYRVR